MAPVEMLPDQVDALQVKILSTKLPDGTIGYLELPDKKHLVV